MMSSSDFKKFFRRVGSSLTWPFLRKCKINERKTSAIVVTEEFAYRKPTSEASDLSMNTNCPVPEPAPDYDPEPDYRIDDAYFEALPKICPPRTNSGYVSKLPTLEEECLSLHTPIISTLNQNNEILLNEKKKLTNMHQNRKAENMPQTLYDSTIFCRQSQTLENPMVNTKMDHKDLMANNARNFSNNSCNPGKPSNVADKHALIFEAPAYHHKKVAKILPGYKPPAFDTYGIPKDHHAQSIKCYIDYRAQGFNQATDDNERFFGSDEDLNVYDETHKTRPIDVIELEYDRTSSCYGNCPNPSTLMRARLRQRKDRSLRGSVLNANVFENPKNPCTCNYEHPNSIPNCSSGPQAFDASNDFKKFKQNGKFVDTYR